MTEAGFGLLILIALLILGAPVGFAFAVSVLFLIATLGYDPQFLLPYSFGRMSSPLLLAIPLFIIAGSLMERGNLTRHLIAFTDSLVGTLRGGLGTAGVVASAVFGAISGSAGAAICSIGAIMIPRLTEDEGYPRAYATALMVASAGLSLLIPPSMTMIIYGWVTATPVTACFLAGFFPGILLASAFIFINLTAIARYPTVRRPREWRGLRVAGRQIAESGRTALPALMMPVIILGSIYGGIATPTEAAAVAVAYSIPVGVFVYKGLNRHNFQEALIESAMSIGSIMVMLFFSMMLSRILAEEGVPERAASALLSLSDSKYAMLLVINLILFVFGMFIDDTSGVIIAAPLLLPIVQELGLSQVHFAAIIATNLTMGNLTPPMAPLVFIGQRIGKVPFADVIRPSLVFVFAGYLPVVFLATFFPFISEWLPKLVLGAKVLSGTP